MLNFFSHMFSTSSQIWEKREGLGPLDGYRPPGPWVLHPTIRNRQLFPLEKGRKTRMDGELLASHLPKRAPGFLNFSVKLPPAY